MKKVMISVMLVLCAALIAICILLYRKMDENAPKISVPDTQIAYTEGDPMDALLEGVTAYDEEDGDVSDSLQVEAIRTLQGDKQAVVVYVAKDKSNNIVTKNRTIDYIAVTEKISVYETEQPKATENASESAGSDEPEGTQQPENEGEDAVDPAAEEAAAQAAAEAQFASLSDDSPRLTLTATKVAVAAGESFSPLSYVKEITDDKDKREELFRRIQISGEYDLSAPGTYELVYYVLDSDQNQSNQATLTLIVQ